MRIMEEPSPDFLPPLLLYFPKTHDPQSEIRDSQSGSFGKT